MIDVVDMLHLAWSLARCATRVDLGPSPNMPFPGWEQAPPSLHFPSSSTSAMSSPSGDTEPDIATWDSIHLGVSNGDFARLVPQSPAARQLFVQVARQLETDRDSWHHVRQFIHYESTILNESTTDSSFAAAVTSTHREDTVQQDFCGYYRLNMSIPPANPALGWVLGSSRPKKPDDFVDFLLAPHSSGHGLHSRHCRLRRLLNTGVLLAVSDSRKVLRLPSRCTVRLIRVVGQR